MSSPTTVGPGRRLTIVGWVMAAMAGPVLQVVTTVGADQRDWHWAIGMLAFAPAAALILIRRPGNRVGLILAVGASAAGAIFVSGWAFDRVSGGSASAALEHLSDVSTVVMLWALISLLFLFPSGRAMSRRWRTVHAAFSVVFLGLVPLARVLRPGPMDVSGRTNPFGAPVPWLATLLDAVFLLLPLAAVAGVASLVIRFRRSAGVERAQLKMFVFGAVLLIVLVTVLGVVPEGSVVDGVLPILVVLGFWGLPAAIVAAILRYRLYDIDRIASRTVTYLITVSLLGFGYVGLVVGLQAVLPFEGALPVAVSTLATASVSLPLVRVTQRFVDRRFFRSRYDSQEVVAQFAGVVRSNVDLDELVDRLTDLVGATFEPSAIAVWLAPPGPP